MKGKKWKGADSAPIMTHFHQTSDFLRTGSRAPRRPGKFLKIIVGQLLIGFDPKIPAPDVNRARRMQSA
jgi:hypothetical protein